MTIDETLSEGGAYNPRLADPAVRMGRYFPEHDYRADGYRRRGTIYRSKSTGKIWAEGPKEHFCNRCIDYYKKLSAAGLYPSRKFKVPCQGDYAQRVKAFTPQDLEEIGLKTPEDQDMFLISLDPARWIEYELGIKLDWYQEEIVRCSSLKKITRGGRRAGKTVAVDAFILWAMYTKLGYDKPKFEIILICPYEAQVKKNFDNIMSMIGQSKNLESAVAGKRQSPHHELQFHNGSFLRGFSASTSSAAGSNKIRGQDADGVVFEEMDYIADEHLETTMAVAGSQREVFIMGISTPTGGKTKFQQLILDKSQNFKEFWFISKESPRWSPEAESFFRNLYSPGGYDREFNAEFGQPTAGVFRQTDLDKAVRKYEYALCRRDPRKIYGIGVDWNKLTGTHIVVLEFDPTAKKDRFAIVEKSIIRKGDFVHLAGVDEITRLDNKWNPAFIYVDQGYGAVQVEVMQKSDKVDHGGAMNYRDRLHSINMRNKVRIVDPKNPGRWVEKEAKPFMIDVLSAWVSAGEIVFPECEDTSASIIEDEIPFLNVGVVQQMREFKVEGVSPQGVERYSQGYEHTLIALALACMGFAQRSDLSTRPADNPVVVSNAPLPTNATGGQKPPVSAAEKTRPGRELAQQKPTMEESILMEIRERGGLRTPTRTSTRFSPPGRTIP